MRIMIVALSAFLLAACQEEPRTIFVDGSGPDEQELVKTLRSAASDSTDAVSGFKQAVIDARASGYLVDYECAVEATHIDEDDPADYGEGEVIFYSSGWRVESPCEYEIISIRKYIYRRGEE